VRIKIEGRGYRSVPQPFLSDLWMYTSGQQLRSVAVPQVMKPDPGHVLDPLYQASELVRKALWLQRFAVPLAHTKVSPVCRMPSFRSSSACLRLSLRSSSTEKMGKVTARVLAPRRQSLRSPSTLGCPYQNKPIRQSNRCLKTKFSTKPLTPDDGYFLGFSTPFF
jgi:hypothetical protein